MVADESWNCSTFLTGKLIVWRSQSVRFCILNDFIVSNIQDIFFSIETVYGLAINVMVVIVSFWFINWNQNG